MQNLSETKWRVLAAQHEARLSPFVEAHRARKSRGEKHAVHDFLWEYYSFRPAQLLKWSPGIGVRLENAAKCELFSAREYSRDENDVWLDARNVPQVRRETLFYVAHLLRETASRPAFFGCFGLHEWAMLYRCEEARHTQLPMRLSPQEIASAVESGEVRCSHHDAFRFFAPHAIALNSLQPRRENQAEFEQPGCLHANMDLYKWAFKFYPFIGSDILLDAFELARDARILDMRATPYDLSRYALAPIRIETPEGKREYSHLQREIARRAQPIRTRVLAAYESLIENLSGTEIAFVRC